MANNSIIAFDKSPHPVTLDTLAPRQKSPFTSEDMTVALPIEKKAISESDAEKLQYFDDINSLLRKFRELLNGAEQRTEIANDLILKRQFTLNSVANLLTSMDNVTLTEEDLSLLDKTSQEMEQVLRQASQIKQIDSTGVKIDVHTEAVSKETTERECDTSLGGGGPGWAPYIPYMPPTPTPAPPRPAPKAPLVNDKTLCNKLSELLNKADSEYLHVYEYAMKVRSKFQENIAYIQQEIPKHIYNDSDKKNSGNIKVDSKDIYELFGKTFDFGDSRDSLKKRTLYPPDFDHSSTPGATKEDAEHWAKEFPGSKVVCLNPKMISHNEYIVVIDYDAVTNLRKSINDIKVGGHVTEYPVNGRSMTTTQFQTWQTGFNSEIESIKTATQEIAQGYNSATSTMSTVAKLMTSCISTLYESCNMCLRF